jgi:hypothetical protein
VDPKDYQSSPLFHLNTPDQVFYGFNGYEDSSGDLSSFNSITLDRKKFDDTVSLIADVNKEMVTVKQRLAVLTGSYKANAAVESDSAV